MKVPTEVMPLEHCALLREHLTAYRLLEDHALKVGGMGGETDCLSWSGEVGDRAAGQMVVPESAARSRIRVVGLPCGRVLINTLHPPMPAAR